ncbi:hypothetical protein HYH03_000014 [Edaphochlamys debaryana]|uniref:Uncharacterized protein n=1 Tax=Edaphochlamys debaryana TaxID=47281 RepID=A0A836C788_9CHLO|nr:hypothetical protein HYH03_000014 [Edaphochlamys debaryana]|eukprot:KAG2501507.1 hypothetical protein HYH03_000014 [Edaphochlamys debaryana]
MGCGASAASAPRLRPREAGVGAGATVRGAGGLPAGSAAGSGAPLDGVGGRRVAPPRRDPGPPPVPYDSVPAATLLPRAVSLRGLRRLRTAAVAALGANRYTAVSTAELVSDWLGPAVAAVSGATSAVDPVADLVDPSDVGHPWIFISHAWAGRAAVLFDAAEAALVAAEAERGSDGGGGGGAGDSGNGGRKGSGFGGGDGALCAWIDIFATDLRPGHHAGHVGAVMAAVAAARGGTLVVADPDLVYNTRPAAALPLTSGTGGTFVHRPGAAASVAAPTSPSCHVQGNACGADAGSGSGSGSGSGESGSVADPADPASRAWCLLEWAACLDAHGPDRLLVHPYPHPFPHSRPPAAPCLPATSPTAAADFASPPESPTSDGGGDGGGGGGALLAGFDGAGGGEAAAVGPGAAALAARLPPEGLAAAAAAHDGDLAAALAAAVALRGSAAAFSQRLTLALALRPLCLDPGFGAAAKAAARRAQAAGAAWDWGPVTSWLSGGPRGGAAGAGRLPRVLCIAGGSGEGKSAAAAALAAALQARAGAAGGGVRPVAIGGGPAAGAAAPLPVLAAHFAAAADARSRDPGEVVRGLAFQLAERLPQLRSRMATPGALAALAAAAADGDEAAAAAARALLKDPLAAAAREAGPLPQIVILIDGLDEACEPDGTVISPGGANAWYGPQPLSPATASQNLSGSILGDSGVILSPCAPSMSRPQFSTAAPPTVACPNRLFSLLTQQLGALPASVRFIVTTRTTAVLAAGVTLAAALDASFAEDGGVAHVSVQELCTARPGRGSTDLLPHVAGMLESYEALLPSSTQLHLDDHDAGPRAREDEESQPGPIALLEALTAAQEPLPAALLRRMGLGGALAAALKAAGGGGPRGGGGTKTLSILWLDEHDGKVYGMCRTLYEWLVYGSIGGCGADSGMGARGGQPRLNMAAGHARIASALMAAVRGASKVERSHVPYAPYTLRHLVHHLVAALEASTAGVDRPTHVRALEELFTGDPGFLAAAFAAGYGRTACAQDLHRLTKPSLSSLGTAVPEALSDCQRWLAGAGGRELAAAGAACTAADVSASLLRHCPTGSALFRRTEEAAGREPGAAATVAAAARAGAGAGADGGGGRWRLAAAVGAAKRWVPLRSRLQGHSGPVTCLTWSPCGALLGSGGCDELLRVWEAAGGRCVAALEDHSSELTGVAWSPDGFRLASSSSGDEVITLWQDGSWRVWPITCVSWSPEGAHVAGGSELGALHVWAAGSGRVVATHEGHVKQVSGVAWAPDGTRVASAGRDRKIKVYDMASGECLQTIKAEARLTCLAWSPDGESLAAGDEEGGVGVWDVEGGERTQALKASGGEGGHSGAVAAVAWRPPEGQLLASAGAEGGVRLWSALTGRCLAVLRGHASAVSCLAWAPSGRTLGSGGADGAVALWELPGGPGRQSVTAVDTAEEEAAHAGPVQALAWAPPGPESGPEAAEGTGRRLLASGGPDGAVRVWAVGPGWAAAECTATLQSRSGLVRCLAWLPRSTSGGGAGGGGRGTLAVGGGGDGCVRLWDPASGSSGARSMQCHAGPVTCLALSPGGPAAGDPSAGLPLPMPLPLLASGGEDKVVRLWEGGGGKCRGNLKGHTAALTALAWSPDGGALASAAAGEAGPGGLRLWDPGAGRCVGELQGPEGGTDCIAWAPLDGGGGGAGGGADGGGSSGRALLAAAGRADAAVRLYDPRSGACVRRLRGHTGPVTCLADAGSAGGGAGGRPLLLSGGEDRCVRVWDAGAGRCVGELQGHASAVRCVAAEAGGGAVASGGADGGVRCWAWEAEGRR